MSPAEAAVLLREYAYKVEHRCNSPAWEDTRVSVQHCHEIANLIDELAKHSTSELLRRIEAAVAILTRGAK